MIIFETSAGFSTYTFLLLADLIGYLYLLLKIFRILCFTKITLDQLPVLNPYKWPFSLIRIITKPYFKFWATLLPSLKVGKVSYDVSAILALEFLTSIISITLQFRAFTLLQLQQIIIENT